MELKIKKIEDKKVIVNFANEILEVSETSDNWNMQGINKFLIKLASSTPDKINIIYDENDNQENDLYNHVVSLFKVFAEEFNKKLENETTK